MATKKAFVAPKQKRQYYSIQKPVAGLVLDRATTMIPDTATPNCAEVRFKNGIITKAFGWVVFADTDVGMPLVCSLIVPLLRGHNLNGTINVFHSPSYRIIPNRLSVKKTKVTANLVCRVSGHVIGATSNLVSRVTIYNATTSNLVGRFTVLKKGVSSGWMRLTVTH